MRPRFRGDIFETEVAWSRPIKMHKCDSSHLRSNAIGQDLNDRIEECE